MNSLASSSVTEELGQLTGTAFGSPSVSLTDKIILNGIDQYLDLFQQSLAEECPYLIQKCNHGFTISMVLEYEGNTDLDQYVITTGGSTDATTGFYLRYKSSNITLPFR